MASASDGLATVSGPRRDPHRHEPGRQRTADIGLAAQRLAHEIDPDRDRRTAALLALAERPLLVEADPDGGDDMGG